MAVQAGDVFGKLTAIRRDAGAKWLCQCTCGKKKAIRSDHLQTGATRSCGCAQRARRTQINAGDTFGRLEVIERAPNRRSRTRWLCRCRCGQETTVDGGHLAAERVRSCGCLKQGPSSRTWMGYRDIPADLWNNLIRGANGSKRRSISVEITIVDLWTLWEAQEGRCALSGVDLVLWPRTARTASVDRIDNARGYVEGNVQWAHKIVNFMKSTQGQDEFVAWCHRIADTR